MKFFYDFLPLLLFFAAFEYFGIYMATAVAMVASVLQTGGFWLRHRRFESMHLVTLGVIIVFGSLTLLFQNDTFIKWKPTVVYWILAAILLASHWIGERTVIDRMLAAQISLPDLIWRRLNLSWAVFFVVLGVVNLYVAFYYGAGRLDDAARTSTWVNFKVFGLMAITIVFVVIQALVMSRHAANPPDQNATPEKRTTD